MSKGTFVKVVDGAFGLAVGAVASAIAPIKGAVEMLANGDVSSDTRDTLFKSVVSDALFSSDSDSDSSKRK